MEMKNREGKKRRPRGDEMKETKYRERGEIKKKKIFSEARVGESEDKESIGIVQGLLLTAARLKKKKVVFLEGRGEG